MTGHGFINRRREEQKIKEKGLSCQNFSSSLLLLKNGSLARDDA
jgi:hypothetical protein